MVHRVEYKFFEGHCLKRDFRASKDGSPRLYLYRAVTEEEHDIRFGVLIADGRSAPLRVLDAMTNRRGPCFRNELHAILGSKDGPSDDLLNVVIARLRSLLGDSGKKEKFIRRIRGEAYEFLVEFECIKEFKGLAAWITRGFVPRPDILAAQGEFDELKRDIALQSRANTDNAIVRDGSDLEQPTSLTTSGSPGLTIRVGKLPTVSPALIGRDHFLDDLDAAWRDPTTGVYSIVAFGGVGKTALALNWWHTRGAKGARRILGWSAYSQGAREDTQASADVFLNHALTEWFDVSAPPTDSWQRGELLAQLIRKDTALLILDGLEPLQYPPGPQCGCFRDRGMVALLKELSASNSGLCICTSRLPLADLVDYHSHGVRQVELDNLTSDAGAQYLASLGVYGTEPELRTASTEFGNHALALTLLGNLLRRLGGDVLRRDMLPSLFDAREGGHARRIMREYEIMFRGQPELKILHTLGLFDRPADPSAFSASCDLTDYERLAALENLADARLVQYADIDGHLECHPLVREHFSDAFKASDLEAFLQAHLRLYRHYSALAPHRPATTAMMTPLFNSVFHGCRAECYQETWDSIYVERILRGPDEYYLTQKLGELGMSLALMANFFERPWDLLQKGLDKKTELWILSDVGFTLSRLLRLRDAVPPTRGALTGYTDLCDWESAALVANNLSELLLTLGQIDQAISSAEAAVRYADRCTSTLCRMGCRATRGRALHQAGRLDESLRAFEDAEAVQAEFEPAQPFLYGQPLFQYCDLLLDHNRSDEVTMRIERSRTLSTRLYFEALDHLVLGRTGSRDTAEARSHLDEAVTTLRNAENLDHLPLALLARAGNRRATKDFSKAHADLAEVRALVTRPGLLLHLVDYHLEMARLTTAENRWVEAQGHHQTACALIERTGYRRRSHELKELEQLVVPDTNGAARRLDS